MATIGILDDYISRKQLAADLGYAEATLIRWEKDGKGPPVTRIGRDVVYSIPSFKKWLKDQERAAKGAAANAA
jgi:predicted DNA-binding transcriptional regulator AlpA